MATAAWIVVCKQAPDLNAANMNQQCPGSQRTSVKTTLEALQQQTTTSPTETIDLDPAQVGAVFSVAFSAVMLFYLVARGAGTVLSLIRHG